MRCKFCGCTDDRPCVISIDYLPEEHQATFPSPYFACAWLIPEVCTAPACVEQAYIAVNPFAIVGEGRIVA